jgi:hypothetical protein
LLPLRGASLGGEAGQVSGEEGSGMSRDQGKVTRITLVDETGRVYERRDLIVELDYQDDGRTLKVFVRPRKESA